MKKFMELLEEKEDLSFLKKELHEELVENISIIASYFSEK